MNDNVPKREIKMIGVVAFVALVALFFCAVNALGPSTGGSLVGFGLVIGAVVAIVVAGVALLFKRS